MLSDSFGAESAPIDFDFVENTLTETGISTTLRRQSPPSSHHTVVSQRQWDTLKMWLEGTPGLAPACWIWQNVAFSEDETVTLLLTTNGYCLGQQLLGWLHFR